MRALEACDIAAAASGTSWATALVAIFAVFVFADIVLSSWSLAKLVRANEIKKI